MVGQIGQSARKSGRFVEGLWPFNAQPDSSAELPESDVDVVEDLDVIAEEADGLNHNGLVAFFSESFQSVFDGRADPWSSRDAL